MTNGQISADLPNNPALVFTSKTARYLLVFAVVSAAVCVLILLAQDSIEDPVVRSCLQLILCFGFGAVNVHLKRNLRGGGLFKNRLRLIIIQALLFGTMVAFVSYYFLHIEILMITAWIAAFLLPVCVDEACLAFREMPGVAIIIWHPADEERLQKRVQYKKDLSIEFRLTKKTGVSGSAPVTIRHQASEYDLLGHAFNQLTSFGIAGVEHEVDLKDSEGYDFDWAFYTPDLLLGKRWLDPYVTIRQNKIKKEMRIIVKRIKTSDL